jgi:hypothetical protein
MMDIESGMVALQAGACSKIAKSKSEPNGCINIFGRDNAPIHEA